MTDTEEMDYYASLIEDARQYKEEFEAGLGAEGNAAFLNDGTYYFRIFPELVKNRLTLIRRFFSHHIPKIGWFMCGEHCKICPQTDRLAEHNVDKSWQQESRELGLVKVYLRDTTADNEYLKPKTHMTLILYPRQIYAIQAFIAELEPEDLREVLDVTDKHQGFKMVFSSGKKGTCTFSLDEKSYEVPALPNDFPKLSEIFVTEDQFPDDKQMKRIKAFVSSQIAKSVDFHSPDDHEDTGTLSAADAAELMGADDDEDNLMTSTRSEKKKEKEKSNKKKSKKVIEAEVEDEEEEEVKAKPKETKSKDKNKCPSKDAELSFGNHPAATHPHCLACEYEDECIAATEKSK